MANDDNCEWSKKLVGVRQRTVEDIPQVDFGDAKYEPKGQPAPNWLERSFGVVKNTDGD